MVLFSSAKVDDAHISLKAFLFIKLFNNLLRCSRPKWLGCFYIFSHGRLCILLISCMQDRIIHRGVMDRALHEYGFAGSSSGKPTCSLALLSYNPSVPWDSPLAEV